MKILVKILKTISAYFRLSEKHVCEMSVGKGYFDYHDYKDCKCGNPWHFTPHYCKRCGKEFHI